MSVDDPMKMYQAACERYAQAVLTAQRDREAAEERYRDEVATVRQSAEHVVAVREQTAREAAAATELVAETDDACSEMWRRLGVYVGNQRLGLTPPPGAGEGVQSAAEVREGIQRAQRIIALAQRGELPFAPPKHAVWFAACVGAVVGALAAWGAGILSQAAGSGDGADAIGHAAALAVLFLGAFAAVPVVAGWLSTRHRMGARPVHVAACVLGAGAAMCGLAPWTFVG